MNQSAKKLLGRFVLYVFVLLFVILLLLPFIWQFLTSIKQMDEISAIPAQWFPKKINLQFYVNVFTKHSFGHYLLNSAVVATVSTLLSVIIGASAAYALSRLRFHGKKALLLAIISISMFPTIATLSPLYMFLKTTHLLNDYAGLILTYMTFSLPMGIWLMSNFFGQLPKGFEEAAAIDGCSPMRTFFSIMLPLIKPATFSVGLLVFINCWNEYLYALTFMTKDSMRTVPVGIALFATNYQLPWGDMAAASIVATVPLIALVLLFQKKIVAGLTTGGIKG
jgi:multiple sugar transport system permease protein